MRRRRRGWWQRQWEKREEVLQKLSIGLIGIRKIEAAQDIVASLARNPNVMFVSEKSPNMLMIPATPGVNVTGQAPGYTYRRS